MENSPQMCAPVSWQAQQLIWLTVIQVAYLPIYIYNQLSGEFSFFMRKFTTLPKMTLGCGKLIMCAAHFVRLYLIRNEPQAQEHKICENC